MINKIMSKVVLALIWFYQATISPLLGSNCRYSPTCSVYATEAVKKHGPWKGGYHAAKRFLSCHPWGGSGHDPVL